MADASRPGLTIDLTGRPGFTNPCENQLFAARGPKKSPARTIRLRKPVAAAALRRRSISTRMAPFRVPVSWSDDIAVRMIRPTQEALVARRIGAVELGMHAHRSYLERQGIPEAITSLRDHSLIGFDKQTAFTREFTRGQPALQRAAFSLRTDSDLAQLAAIRAGCGIGICQVALARRDPDLVRVLPRAFSMKLDTWLVMHEDLRLSPRCSVTFKALSEGLKRHAEIPSHGRSAQ